MLAQDIPPSLSVVGSQQRRTRAIPKEHQLDRLISTGLVHPNTREGKKGRNVEFSASTDNLGTSPQSAHRRCFAKLS
jgi:hypothetical protein